MLCTLTSKCFLYVHVIFLVNALLERKELHVSLSSLNDLKTLTKD